MENCYEKKINVTDFYVYTYEYICEHKVGYARITEIGENNIIKKASITIIGLAGFAESGKEGFSGFYVGRDVNTEIHEILHTFGYPHSTDKDSIMYPLEKD